MQRMTIYLPEGLAEQIRADAETKGQPLSTWFTRAAESALIESDLTPKDWSNRLARRSGPIPRRAKPLSRVADTKREAR